jgi:polysaccharide biosynthesis/export protein
VKLFYSCALVLALSACASYKQNIMFKPEEGYVPPQITSDAITAEKDYIIQKNDLLRLDVFSNKGERLIDPNPELTNTPTGTSTTSKQQFTYLVDREGRAKFPMIGTLKLDGLTLRQSEEILQKEYENYFKEPFVILTYANKRVIVLGAVGGQVIPLNNQNVTLVEVLAMAKGLPNDAKAKNIRIIRSDQVYLVDMSTIEGFKKGNMLIQAGDIVYVEPVRRPFTEGIRDYIGIGSFLISLATLFLVYETR